MELLLHQWGDWPELYRNTDKTEATEIVIIDSQMNYRGKLDTYAVNPGPQSSPDYAIIDTYCSATGWGGLGIIQVFSLFPQVRHEAGRNKESTFFIPYSADEKGEK